MKRHTILIYVAAVLTMCVNLLPANAQKKQTQDALYIYRNDGGFHGFFYGEIDRFEYSKVDTLGVEHDDFVVQEIYARDTVYRIPINAIDSIGFVTPENIYKEDVAVTTESDLWNYVIKSDTLYSFTLASNTPAAIIPKVGDKVAKTEYTPNLEYGIYGIVESVETKTDGIEVTCVPAPVSDLFDRYTTKIAIVQDDENIAQARRRDILVEKDWNWKGVHIKDFPFEKVLNLWKRTPDVLSLGYKDTSASYQGDGKLTLEITPKTHLYLFFSSSFWTGDMLDIQFGSQLETNFELSLEGKITLQQDLAMPEIKLPLLESPFIFHAKVGIFGSLAGTLDLKLKEYDKTRVIFQQRYKNPYTLKSSLWGLASQALLTDPDASFNVSGNLIHLDRKSGLAVTAKLEAQAGFFLNLGICLVDPDLADVGMRFEGGKRFRAETSFSVLDKDIPTELGSRATFQYDELNKDDAINCTNFVTWTAYGSIGEKIRNNEGKVTNWKWGKGISFTPVDKELGEPWKWGVVPEFPNVNLKYDDKTKTATAYATITRSLANEVPVGFALYNTETNKIIGSPKWYEKKYKTTDKTPNFSIYSIEFPNIEAGQKLRAYPTVEFWERKMLASPYKDIENKFSMKLTPEELSFKAAGGTQSVTIEHNGNASKFNIGVSTTDEEKDWCTAKLSDNKITVKAAKNKKMKDRYATITVTYGEGANMVVKEIKVTQEAAEEEDIPAANNANDLWYTFRHSSAQDASYYVLMTFGKDGSYEWNYYTPKGLSSWERGTYEVISSKPNSTVEVTYNSYVPETIEVGKWINKTGVGWFGKKEKWTNANYYRLKITYVTASNVQKTKEIEVYANSSNKVLGYEFYEDTKIPRIWYEECVWWDTDNLISLIFNGQ